MLVCYNQPMTPAYGPYSPIKKAGETCYISGQIGIDPATKQAEADITTQTKQVLANLEALLGEAGLTRANVVKTTVFLTDMGDFAAMNEVFQEFFPAPRPARSTIGVNELPRVGDQPLLVEIEAVAYKAA